MTNSIHDMGGMHGFGPVEPEADEPVFHADWEKRVLAMQRAIAAGHSLRPGIRLNRKMTLGDAKASRYANFERPAPAPARFKAGDQVRTHNLNPTTHTRLPRYARGKLGTVEAVRGYHVYPDT